MLFVKNVKKIVYENGVQSAFFDTAAVFSPALDAGV